MSVLSQRLAALPPEKRRLLVRRNPLSPAQERLWILDRLHGGSPFYNGSIALLLEGRLRRRLLEDALREVVRRHEVLRTSFPEVEGRPLQAVGSADRVGLPTVDLTGLRVSDREAVCWLLIRIFARRPFRLSRGPLLRIALFRLGERRHVLAVVTHHIVADRLSFGVFGRELSALYRARVTGRAPHLPELPIQYRDFARWQRDRLERGAMDAGLAYWRQRLAGIAPDLGLPTDRPRGAEERFAGARRVRALTPLHRDALRRLVQDHGGTEFSTVLALLVALLHRYTGRCDVPVGVAVDGRRRVELEGLVGLFVNTIVLRTAVEPDTRLCELLDRAHHTVLEAHEHASVPFERVVEALSPERDLSHNPLFQVQLAVLGEPGTAPALHGLRTGVLEIDRGTAMFDLTLVVERGDTPRVLLEHKADLFDRTTADRILRHFTRLLEAGAAQPDRAVGELCLLEPAERHHALVEWNDTGRPLGGGLTVAHRVRAQAEERPDAVAVRATEGQLSYGELDRRVARLADGLRRSGVRAGELVGISVGRTADLVASILAIFELGAAYLPLDPELPRHRIELMLKDSGCGTVLAGPGASRMPRGVRTVDARDLAEGDGAERGPWPDPQDIAYVIYTSGSTGRPKGVAVPHRAVTNFLASMARRPGVGPGDRCLAVTTLSFDISVLELLLPLWVGGAVLLASGRDAEEPARLRDRIAAWRPTVAQATPVTWGGLLEAGWRDGADLLVLCGGETMGRDLAEALLATGGDLWNVYGPTETTVWSSIEPVGRAPGPVPVGRPIANTRIHLLDSRLRAVPRGAAGELVIGGDGVALGYLGRPARTAERFVPDPFAREVGARMYRTGDLARTRPDGRLECLGRFDDQVKLRGHRIELGEIEAALEGHPGVLGAVARVRDDVGDADCLVAYVRTTGEAAGEEGGEPSDLLAWLRDRLPAPMVPSHVVPLERFPSTPSGKVARAALPRPEPASGSRYEAPSTAIEGILAELWTELLGTESIGRSDHFFELGGHSLLATRLIAGIRRVCQVELPLRTVFDHPRLRDLARAVEERRRTEPRERPRRPVRARRDRDLPLSFAQRRLWFLDRLEPGTPYYNVVGAVRLRGRLDLSALARALREIVLRHEILRTVFVERGGEPVQVILGCSPGDLPVIGLDSLPVGFRGAARERWLRQQARSPFDLARGPLFRPALARLSPGEHVLSLCLHHIVSDGWSTGILVRELMHHYGQLASGEAPALRELPIQYADYARWQRDELDGEPLRRLLEGARQRLAGAPEVLPLAPDRPRPARRSLRGGRVAVRLPAERAAALRRLGRDEGATLFMVLLAAFQSVLGRHADSEDFLLGAPVAGRTVPEVEGLIGCFVNLLVLRTDLRGRPTFRDLVGRAREAVLEASLQEELPFESLVEELAPERRLSHTPLVQVLIGLQRLDAGELQLPGMEAEPLEVDTGRVKFDLNLRLVEAGREVRGVLEFAADLFDPTTAARLLRHFRRTVAVVAEDPDRPLDTIAMLDRAEVHQLSVEANDTAGHFLRAPEPVHEIFAHRAQREPDRIGAVTGEERLSYGELARRSAGVAETLGELGVGPESPVVTVVERSVDGLVGLLGVLRAGGAYVPVDPDQPAARLITILEESGARVVVGSGRLPEGLPPDVERVDVRAAGDRPGDGRLRRSVRPLPENLAYVIFTSGSTGRPKGVGVEHRQLAGYVRAILSRIDPPEGGSWALVSTLAADLGNTQLYGALCSGGELHLIAEGVALDGRAVARYLEEHRIDLLKLVPSHLRALLPERDTAGSAPVPPLPQRWLILGGEAVPQGWVEDLHRRAGSTRILDHYGPTEATVGVLTDEVCLGEDPTLSGGWPVGRPLMGRRIQILGRDLRPVPVNVPGEVAIGGSGVARGYYGRPGATAAVFVPDPLASGPGERIYRTGDRGRRLRDGRVEFLGRLDRQLKVRGHRVEPGEVEKVLETHPAVRQALVTLGGGGELVAYCVLEGEAFDGEELRRRAAIHLPSSMVPSAIVPLERFPLTANGKLDLEALPGWGGRTDERALRGGTTRTVTEEILGGLWGELLRCDRVAPHDEFFELGGHSLLVTRMIARVRDLIGVELAVRDVFDRPVLSDLAARIDALRRSGDRQPAPAPGAARQGEAPLTFTQEWIWLHDRLHPGTDFYNVPGALRLEGALDLGALRCSLTGISRRHALLRTSFPESNGQPVQRVHRPAPAALPVVDLSGLPQPECSAAAEGILESQAARPFAPEREPPVRTALIRKAEQEHLLVVVRHHLVSDAWSSGLFYRELAELYGASTEGRAPSLPELPFQYADFAAWQRTSLRGAALERAQAYWRRRMADPPPPLELPADRPRPLEPSFRGDRVAVPTSVPVAEGVRGVARECGATPFMVLAAAFHTLLGFASGLEDLIVGMNAAGRSVAGTERLIGPFIQQLPLRIDRTGARTFPELVGRTREAVLGAYAHQELPFARLLDEVGGRRGGTTDLGPPFRVKIDFQSGLMPVTTLPDVKVERVHLDNDVVRYDLHLTAVDDGSDLDLGLRFRTDLFERSTAERFAGMLGALLAAVADDPRVDLGRLENLLAEHEARERAAAGERLEELGRSRLRRVRRRVVNA